MHAVHSGAHILIKFERGGGEGGELNCGTDVPNSDIQMWTQSIAKQLCIICIFKPDRCWDRLFTKK